MPRLSTILILLACSAYAQTNLVITRDTPSGEIRAMLVDASGSTRTNAPLQIKTCPVLIFDATVWDGFDAAQYTVYSTSALTGEWSAAHSFFAEGQRVCIVDDEAADTRFFVLETSQYVVIEVLQPETNGIPTNTTGTVTNEPPPIPGE